MKYIAFLSLFSVTVAQEYINSTRVYSSNNRLRIDVPPLAKNGDLLVLFLSRTDDYLPMQMDNWKSVAQCFKTDNGDKRCMINADCKRNFSWDEKKYRYCSRFSSGGTGQDLATSVFTREMDNQAPNQFVFELKGKHPSWAILMAVRGVNPEDPVRSFTTASCDKEKQSVFPSVDGNKGDLLLLSMAFDDTTTRNKFQTPSGTSMLDFVAGNDEAGVIYGKTLTANGPTGKQKTRGDGASACKDALISMVMQGGSGGRRTIKKPACDATNGDISSCCTDTKSCGLGQGDCDSDDECLGNLRCGTNNCESDFGFGGPRSDCCYQP